VAALAALGTKRFLGRLGMTMEGIGKGETG
jgi:hypothetical protein